MIRSLYSILLYLATPFFLKKLYKSQDDKPAYGSRWHEHFGQCPPLQHNNPVWIHAVSVGEVIAATQLIKAIQRDYPEQAILITTTTSTGAEQAEKLPGRIEHRYMPLDFSWAINKFLRITKPKALLIMETELWPNTLAQAKQAGLPVYVLNARLSERSFRRYKKVQRLFDIVKNNIDYLLCQHSDDAERFVKLGLSEKQVAVTGSVKFDINVSQEIHENGNQLRQLLGQHRPVWIAASTHRGEDEQLLEAFSKVRAEVPDSILILVPRHPERFTEVADLCQASGLTVVRRTEATDGIPDNCDIYLGDTMGEMLVLLAAADIAFIGGSLLGDKVGGHNLLEPAALSKPIITGPSYFNFTDITQQLLDNNGAVVCQDSKEIAAQLIVWFKDEVSREETGQQALQVVIQNQGAIEKTVNNLKPVLTH
ncbi:lipid IV(A) 3-deoxy-D-manno-octulosonic acid transferase [Photobacterium sp. OFAV2-7]|uniref:lipid IV(A) 3-deoxy-D-manno-octulosonic acid transferase n=1 Tax=Photobacterium sp. OFAV2-7 TaxID=2917748 RepID=UPI001EF70388|nr:lipid IV(A) 3-deoxy-D-manno-octulosonic acid transferase [Photobacterium sp. OFAV2-7]MCG7584495.1 lipid IV(A) 3-deoxy-D-manno-octulosonic acid transferase [Photobacterium sp. OFAV2-7]